MSFRGCLVVLLGLSLFVMLAWQSGYHDPVDEVAVAEDRVGRVLSSRMIDVSSSVNVKKSVKNNGKRDVKDVKLHVVTAGPSDGPPVILIHGFPEFWFSWYHQINVLANAGYRVYAPDLRGVNRSSKPADVSDYSVDNYALDILTMMDREGLETAYIAAHNVGAEIVWHILANKPKRVRKALIFSGVYPQSEKKLELAYSTPRIFWQSEFATFPFIPELLARSGNWWMVVNSLNRSSREGSFSPQDLDIYRAAWSREDAMTTAMHYFRAQKLRPEEKSVEINLTVPVKMIFGRADLLISEEEIDHSIDAVGRENVEIWPKAGHWLLAEEPERTSWEMITYFRENSPPFQMSRPIGSE